jgi:uncharacterized membrane protein
MSSLLRKFKTDTAGNIALLSSACISVALGCAALGVDLAKVFSDRRKTQSAADLAAMVAAADLPNAAAAANATIVKNGYPASALASLEYGVYTANAAIAPAQRFVPASPSAANAVRVSVHTQAPLIFGKFVSGSEYFDIRTSATATTTSLATFAIGSRLASLNGGLVNAMLGGMLGTTLSLSAMDYQALLDARIDAFDFMNALATRLNVSAVSFTDLLASNIKVSDLVQATLSAQQKANGNNAATSALSSVAQAVNGLSTRVVPSALIDPGPYRGLVVGQKPKTGVSLSAFDLLSATAKLANGTNQISTAVSLGLPGIASVTLLATVGERPQGRSWITVGAQGASVHTAQTRAYLNVRLLGSGSVASVDLPIYVEVASGTATLTQIVCGRTNMQNSSATLGVTPGVIDAWIGQVTPAQMSNMSTAPNPPAATLVTLPLAQVSGRAHAAIANQTAKSVQFSYADIQAQTKKTVTTTAFTASLTSSLLNDLQLDVTLLGFGLPLPGLGPAVSGIISGATSSIDALVATALATLGVGVGQADVWVSGIRCDGAVLVK